MLISEHDTFTQLIPHIQGMYTEAQRITQNAAFDAIEHPQMTRPLPSIQQEEYQVARSEYKDACQSKDSAWDVIQSHYAPLLGLEHQPRYNMYMHQQQRAHLEPLLQDPSQPLSTYPPPVQHALRQAINSAEEQFHRLHLALHTASTRRTRMMELQKAVLNLQT